MLPKVIIHNTVSLDGSVRGFPVDMGLHYRVASAYRPDAHLVGSVTAKMGIQEFMEKVPPETMEDFRKPARSKSLPYWVIPDTKGSLMGLLHALRRFEYCRDVIVLVSGKTPRRYLDYLKQRDYDCIVSGTDRVDLRKALETLGRRYGIRKVLSDTGPTLSGLLLESGLADEISLIIFPALAGGPARLFSGISTPRNLKLVKAEPLGKSVHLVLRIVK